ncbi:Hypothetical protein A7982_01370 [Minicystis rosea]|nr:Hypothetical protein A7982_01370 [Minicystis rosea]
MLAGSLVLVGLTWGGAVRADDEESIRIEYRAPVECPTAQSFVDQLRRRGIHAPIAAPGERARTFEIEVKIDARAHGRLTVTGTDGERVTRTVEGKSCDELVSGLAVMTAVAISPTATPEPLPTPPPPSPPPPPPPGPEPRSLAPAPPRSIAAPVRTRSSRLVVGTGLRAFSVFAVAPSAIFGAGAFVDLEYGRASMRIGVDQTFPILMGTEPARARFGWTTARVELCPISAGVAWLEFAPCGVLNAGAIWAIDSGGEEPQNGTRFWGAAGARGRVRATFARRFWAELGAAVTATFIRDRFILRPSTTIYAPGPVSVEPSLAVGLRFP